MSMKILFMGTPDYAAICFKAIAEAGYTLVGAVTQPDKPKGRGYEKTCPPVKLAAEELGVPVFQPESLRDGAFAPTLAELDPEVIAVAAYGKILPEYILNYPKYGCINAHASILPEYRGAAPIQRAIMEGKSETGVTIMQMEKGLDTGDMLLIRKTSIAENDDFGTVHDRLAQIAGEAMTEALHLLERGELKPEKQDDSKSTYAAKITKADCILDFTCPAGALAAAVRGLSPFPLACTKMPGGKLLKIVSAREASGKTESAPGTVAGFEEDGFTVACGEGSLLKVTAVLPEGKGRMSARDFINGRRLAVGDTLKWEQ